MSRGFVVLFFLVLGLGGCGSSTATVSSPSPIGEVDVLEGRAQSEVPLVGASVQVFDQNGTSLPLGALPLTTRNGQFRFSQRSASDFRVVVTPNATTSAQSSGTSLAAEVRDYQNSWVGVNFVTNLVSVYLSLHPDLSLPEAEARVRAFLVIPEGIDLGAGLDNETWFSHRQYASNAGQNGGVAAYTLALAQQVDIGPPQPILAEEEETSLLGGLAKDVGTNLISDELTGGVNNLFGWAVSAAGFNLGGPSMQDLANQLNEIQMQLDALTDLINQLSVQGLYDDDQNTLEPLVTSIQTASAEVQNLASMSQNYNNQPAFGPDQNTVNVINELKGTDWYASCNEILNYQLGINTSNMVVLYGTIVMDSVSADSPTEYQGYPLRSNGDLNQVSGSSFWDQKMNQLSYYLQVVNQGISLIAETSHISARNFQNSNGFYNSNATSMMAAKGQIYQLVEGSRGALQQIPHALPSDQVLIDIENGVTWYLTVQDPAQYSDVNRGTKVYTAPYGSKNGSKNGGNRFDLPTKDQLNALRSRLSKIKNDSSGKYSNDTQALAALGFQLPETNELKVWMYSPDYNANLSHAGPSNYTATTYDFNNGNTTNHNTKKDQDPYHYLLCMTYPGPAETDSLNSLLANGVPANITVESTSPTQLKATTTNNTISSPVQTVTRPLDDITGDVVWSSSNTNVADISNFDGEQGQITWHPANFSQGAVTFTASFLGQQASITLNPPNIPPATLTAIEVLPTNLLYEMPTVATPIQDLYFATAIYSDQTAVDVTQNAVWSLVKTSDSTPIDPAQAGFTTTTPNLLIVTSNLVTPDLTVQATFGGVTGSAQIRVSVPLTP